MVSAGIYLISHSILNILLKTAVGHKIEWTEWEYITHRNNKRNGK